MLMFRRCQLSVTGLLTADRPCANIGPTSQMPSGGVFYMNPLFFAKDVGTRLIALTWQQLQAVWTPSRHCDLVATGALVDRAVARSTSRPYIIFLSAHSSYY